MIMATPTKSDYWMSPTRYCYKCCNIWTSRTSSHWGRYGAISTCSSFRTGSVLTNELSDVCIIMYPHPRSACLALHFKGTEPLGSATTSSRILRASILLFRLLKRTIDFAYASSESIYIPCMRTYRKAKHSSVHLGTKRSNLCEVAFWLCYSCEQRARSKLFNSTLDRFEFPDNASGYQME